MTEPVVGDPYGSLALGDVVEEPVAFDLRCPPDETTRFIVDLLTSQNALVSLEPSRAVFMSGGRLSRVASEVINGDTHYTIKTLEKYGLKGRLAEMHRWLIRDDTFGTPSSDIVADLIERADELCVDMPILDQVITYPIYSRDGVLQSSPGYSRDTRCWYSPVAGIEIPKVPDSPTDDDIEKAKSLIFDELLVDFPFVDQASRANAVTILLEPFARRLIVGPTPIHAIDAPKEGTGKSLLADLMLLPSMGPNPKSSTQSHNEDDWKKQLTTIMLGGTPYWYCDNVRYTLDSGHLASTITKAVYEERILGGNSACIRPIQHTWVITGNNITYSGEMARRVVPSYLNAHSETPQLGRVFRHENVKLWATKNRGGLIWAALVLIQRWIAKGKPRKRVSKVLGMFEAWSEIMGNILALSGITGFLDNLTDFYDEAIQEEHDSSPFVDAWYQVYGEQEVTAAQLVDLAHKHLELEKPIGGMTQRPTSKKVGWFLKKIKKRVYNGLEVVNMPKKAGRPEKYRLVAVKAVAAVSVEDAVGETMVPEDSGDGQNGQNPLNWL